MLVTLIFGQCSSKVMLTDMYPSNSNTDHLQKLQVDFRSISNDKNFMQNFNMHVSLCMARICFILSLCYITIKLINQWLSTTIFVHLCVLCFQKQPFRFFILLHCSWCCAMCGAEKRLAILHRSIAYIFISFRIWLSPFWLLSIQLFSPTLVLLYSW